MKQQASSDEFPIWMKLLSAGTAACIADLATFPLDTAKVRMQVNTYIFQIRPFFDRVYPYRQAIVEFWKYCECKCTCPIVEHVR